MIEPWNQAKVITQSCLILDSYRRWTGEDLLQASGPDPDRAKILYEAPLVVVSHGLGNDPILNYGNRAALELWEMTWDSFIQTPSRLTTEIINRKERAEMLKKVSEQGFSRNYHGVRVSGSGRRFRMDGAVIWNVVDDKETYFGQAAAFKHWFYL